MHCCEDRRLYESARFGLPYAELRCLMLFENQRYLTAKGIAQDLDVAKSRVTKILSGLMKKDLVQEMVDPRDGRVKLFSLTNKGHLKAQEVRAFQRELHRKLLLFMNEQERRNVLFYLEVLHSAMEMLRAELLAGQDPAQSG